MDRPKNSDQRTHILNVARRLFAKNGYNATTIRQIKASAKVAEGLLYYYFPGGKRALLDTIIEDGIASRLEQAILPQPLCSTRKELEQQLMAFFSHAWELFAEPENQESFAITMHERTLLSKAQTDWLQQLIDPLTRQLESQLAGLAGSEQVAPENRQPLANLIVTLFQQSLYQQLLLRQKMQPLAVMQAQIQPQLHLLLQLP